MYLKNIFSFDGQQGHEIVFVHSAKFSDQRAYAQRGMTGVEALLFQYLSKAL